MYVLLLPCLLVAPYSETEVHLHRLPILDPFLTPPNLYLRFAAE